MPETIGQQLKQARLERQISIEKAVQATHIRAHYLEALEADDFESIPSAVQMRGFLKLYAEYLGLSLEVLFARQRGESDPSPEPAPIPGTVAVVEPVSDEPDLPDPLQEPATSPQAYPLEGSAKVEEIPGQPGDQPVENDSVSANVFRSIGDSLHARRESLGLSLDEIERHTHVRKHYLEALELGAFDRLPSSVQARGMLNNYARFLDMDVDTLLLKYAEGLQVQLSERQRKLVEETSSQSEQPAFKLSLPASLRRILSPDVLFGGGLLLVLVAFAIWGTGRILRMNAAVTPLPTAPSISDILLASPVNGDVLPTVTNAPGQTLTSEQAGAALEVTLPPAGNGPVQVIVVADRSAWVKVTVDGKLEFEGRVVAGTAYPFDGNTQIEVVTGDGLAVSIIYNQSNLGAMGAYGEVVDRIYTATTILSPTITFTPSPTISLTPTRTLRPTATPRPSATLRISPTPKVTATPIP
jgi:cytoskeleton protein RodZ